MEQYKLDMHVHTSETSHCGEVCAADMVRAYKEAGYQGIMITDHYHKEYFDSLGDMETRQKIWHYLKGYHAAKEEGERLGMDVLLGIEFRNTASENDFLIVGVTEEFLYENPETYLLPIKEAVDLFHKHGMLVIQAHPIRFRMLDWVNGALFRSYKSDEMLEMIRRNPQIGEISGEAWNRAVREGTIAQLSYPIKLRVCGLQCEDDLDGIEVYNGNYHWAQEPERIQEIMDRHPNYIPISASDAHELGHVARGGLVLNRRVANSQELNRALRENCIIGRIQH